MSTIGDIIPFILYIGFWMFAFMSCWDFSGIKYNIDDGAYDHLPNLWVLFI